MAEGLAELAEPLADSIYAAQAAGWVLGADRLAGDVPESAATPAAGLGAGFAPPPSASALLGPSGGEGPLRLPVIAKAIDRMERSEILLPQDYYAISAAARTNAFTVSADLTESTIGKLRDLVFEDLRAGTNRKAFAAAVEAALPGLPVSEAHLEQVYRNAVNESFSQGQETVLANPLVADAFPFRVYQPIRDDRARPEHLQLERLGIDGTAYYWADDPVWLRFRPPWSWNAVMPWTVLQGRIMYALKTDYSGDVYEFTTKRSRRFSVTENHPILTNRGFVAAKFLNQGDNLLAYDWPAKLANAPMDDVDHEPTRADKIFNSFSRLSGAISVKTSPLDFHGDARFGKGQIEVVAANRELRNRLVSELGKFRGGGDFVAPDLNRAFLACKGPFREGRFGEAAASVSGPNRGEVLGQAFAEKSQFCRVGSAANLDVSRYEPSADGAPRDLEIFGELQFRFPGFVSVDELVKIDIAHYDGPVYDAQTSTGYMVGNGIVLSNCRCGWYAATVEMAADDGLRVAVEWLRTGRQPEKRFASPPSFAPDPRWDRAPFGVGV